MLPVLCGREPIPKKNVSEAIPQIFNLRFIVLRHGANLGTFGSLTHLLK